VDMIAALPQAYRSSYAEVAAPEPVAPQYDKGPSFRVLQNEPIRGRIIVIACILTALATLSGLMKKPISYHPVRNTPESLIDSVLQRPGEPLWSDTANNVGSGSGDGPRYGGNSGEGLYHIGGVVSAPVPLNTVKPELSNEARRARYQGVCLIALTVDAQGNPRNPRVIQTLEMGLDEKALDAVRKYRFKPAMKDGRIPVPVRLTVEVNFSPY
jgi:TonB family protein